MDPQTASILDALDHSNAVVLEKLIFGPATEDELLGLIPDVSQPTGNRRLQRLKGSGLIERELGTKKARGLKWRVCFPRETSEVIEAAYRLADSVGEKDRLERSRAQSELRARRTENG